jgi:hypothetical protein
MPEMNTTIDTGVVRNERIIDEARHEHDVRHLIHPESGEGRKGFLARLAAAFGLSRGRQQPRLATRKHHGS